MSTTISDRLEAATQKAESASDTHQQVTEGDDQAWIPTESGNPIPSIRNVQRQWNDQVDGDLTLSKQYRDESGSNAVRAEAAADRADQIADLETVRDALRLAAVPAPDFHLPLISDLRIQEGFGDPDQIDVSAAQDGSVMVDLPSRSANFSRSSTARYINKSGVPVTAGVDEYRIGKSGALCEPSSTNLITHSSAPEYWNTTRLAIEKNGSLGDLFLYDLVLDGSGSSSIFYKNIPSYPSSDHVMTHSWYLYKRDGGSVRLLINRTIDPNDGTFGTASASYDLDTGTFLSVSKRVIDTHVEIHGNLHIIALTVEYDANPDNTSQKNTHLYFDDNINAGEIRCAFLGCQVELLKSLSSYIVTEEIPLTRNLDTIKFLTDKNYLPDRDFTFCVDAERNNIKDFNVLFSSDHKGVKARCTGSDNRLEFLIGDKVLSKLTILDSPKRFSYVVTREGKLYKSYINGVFQGEELNNTVEDVQAFFGIGAELGNSERWGGNVQNFKIWHKALTGEQISALGNA